MDRKNSYDALRLLAAILVIFSHSFAVTGHDQLGIGQVSFGAFGVWVFFILSGYLISKSWDQYPRFNIFFAKRALRIFPGLIVALLFTVITIGFFFTTLNTGEYFLKQETWSYFNNIFLYNTVSTLPGAFENNLYPNVVNGSLWTLAYEFTMYVLIALIGVFKVYKKVKPIYIWAGFLLLSLLIAIFGKEIFSLSLFYLSMNEIIILGLLFFSGVMMYKYQNIIALKTSYGVVALILFIALSYLLPSYTPIFGATLLTYAIFSIGKIPFFSFVGKYGDFSYGLYIYSFPIQQMIAAATHTTSIGKMFIASLILTLVIAVLSWHLVESKALKLKSKVNPKRYPLDPAMNEAW